MPRPRDQRRRRTRQTNPPPHHLQITLRESRSFYSREYPGQPTATEFRLIEFPAGTVFSKLRRTAHGGVSGISSRLPSTGKRYFVDRIPGSELWGSEADFGVGYYHGGARRYTKKNKRRSTK